MTKNRSVSVPAGTTTVVYTPHGTSPPLANLVMSVPSYESLNEFISHTELRPPSDNNCLHQKTTRNRPRTSITTYASSSGSQVNYYDEVYDNPSHWWTSFFPSTWGLYATSDSGYFGVDPLQLVDLQAKVDASMAYMLPGIRPKLSLLNSLYELKDLKSMPKLIKRISGALANLPGFITGRNSLAYRKKTLRQLTGLSAKSFLSYQWGIRPLIEDIVALRHALTSAKNQLERLVENADKVQIAHYVSKQSVSTVTDYSSFAVPVHYSGGQFKRTISVPEGITFRAAMAYSYRIPASQGLYWKAVLDTLGVNLNPAILWNAVPWSFAVDWVMDVSSWLEQFTQKNLRIVTAIHRYNCSVKLTAKCEVETKYSIGGPGPQTYHPTQVVDYVGYHRSSIQPDLARHITLSGLDSREFSYIGALVLSRL